MPQRPMSQSLVQSMSKTLQSERRQRVHRSHPRRSRCARLWHPIYAWTTWRTAIHHLLHLHRTKRRHLHRLGCAWPTVRKRSGGDAQLLLLGEESHIGNAIPRRPRKAILHLMLLLMLLLVLGECVGGK